LLALVPYPARLRLVLTPLALFGGLVRAVAARTAAGADGRAQGLRARLGAVLTLAPPVTWKGLFARTPAVTRAVGRERAAVGLLSGCVQRLVFGGVNEATVRVLAAEGCTVRVPP